MQLLLHWLQTSVYHRQPARRGKFGVLWVRNDWGKPLSASVPTSLEWPTFPKQSCCDAPVCCRLRQPQWWWSSNFGTRAQHSSWSSFGLNIPRWGPPSTKFAPKVHTIDQIQWTCWWRRAISAASKACVSDWGWIKPCVVIPIAVL